MKTNAELQRDVQAELVWEPGVIATDIGVTVHEGIVRLTGDVVTYVERHNAEHAAKRVAGVKAVVNDIKVRPPASHHRTDAAIARAIVDRLAWEALLPHEQIVVTVSNGHVKLEGEVASVYQRAAAERVVRGITGITGLHNLITIGAQRTAADVKSKIEDAFRRNAEIDARGVSVTVANGTAILSGRVRSFAESIAATRAAAAATGITHVENQLEVVERSARRQLQTS